MKKLIKKILPIINSWKIVILIILIGAGLFYWYQVRPARIYSYCHWEAEESAREILKKKVEIEYNPTYLKAIEEGMYLKDDYESQYKQCLREKGINK